MQQEAAASRRCSSSSNDAREQRADSRKHGGTKGETERCCCFSDLRNLLQRLELTHEEGESFWFSFGESRSERRCEEGERERGHSV